MIVILLYTMSKIQKDPKNISFCRVFMVLNRRKKTVERSCVRISRTAKRSSDERERERVIMERRKGK